MPATQTTYDAIPYLSPSFPRSHPERLTAVAKLFGLDAPPLESCRVLELGCSMGGNLMAMARNHPRVCLGWADKHRYGSPHDGKWQLVLLWLQVLLLYAFTFAAPRT
jgi:hypothetical protein